MPGGDDAERKKRLIIIGISTFLLVAMVIGVTVSITFTKNVSIDEEDPKDNNKSHLSSTVKAVKTLCHPTDYKKECEESLTKEAGNTTDARKLIEIAFQITIKRIGEGLEKANILHEVEKEPRAKEALVTCKQLMDLSIEEFKRSIERLGKFDLNNLDNILTSLKVWLSGAVTYQETCLDAFENTTSDAGNKMKEVLQTAMHMSSNGLAIINELSKTLTTFHITKPVGRRLLQDADDLPVLGHDNDDDEFPEWVEAHVGFRRFLKMNSRKFMSNVIVAKDGSGNFTTITDALKNVPRKNQKPFIIWIKEGVYNEHVEVSRNMTHVVFVGDGSKKTRIIGSKNFIDGINTYNTATVAVQGDYFVAIGVGFENSAGAIKHQAVALRVQADKSIFYKCRMDGFQDTLYVHALRQFYRDCIISGTIDFVFGDAVAVFQNCTFVVRKPMENQQCIVTAQGRKERYQPSGIVIQGGAIVSDPNYYPVRFDNKAYLARPWKNFSRTIFLDTYIGDLIQPEGYMPWQTDKGLPTNTETCFYAEVNNRGPGSDLAKRVKWQGVKNLTPQIATDFYPSKFFHGDDWIRVTNIPYSSGKNSSKH
ncbi:putative pectinesterase [Lupinus albus]|uniref:Pectinesterase n=1 Tax=Lupinus albus TaxID=3870 RepID=A0A6A4PCR1_LUPAL|nr:putative pectinesterase [Lupinus albus]